MSLREVYVCPTCGGEGHIVGALPHDHEWRLAISMHGDGFDYRRWVCMADDCPAVICSDCLADGLEVCAAGSGEGTG